MPETTPRPRLLGRGLPQRDLSGVRVAAARFLLHWRWLVIDWCLCRLGRRDWGLVQSRVAPAVEKKKEKKRKNVVMSYYCINVLLYCCITVFYYYNIIV